MDKWPPEWLNWTKPTQYRSVIGTEKIHICPECGQEFPIYEACPKCHITMGRRGWRQLGVYDG